VPDWLLWVLAILGAGSLARFPSIDWAADPTYSVTTLLLFGASVAAAITLVRRKVFGADEDARSGPDFSQPA